MRITLVAVLASLLVAACNAHVSRGSGVPAEPALRIESPAAGAWVGSTALVVEGVAENVAVVDVNGVTATVTDGRFSANITVDEGPAHIEARGDDTLTDSIDVNVDTTSPVITLTDPSDGFIRG